MPGSRPTMADVAAAAGVCKATVSRVLRADPACAPALRERVQAAADRLGYRPDALQSLHMARLRSGRPPAATTVGILDDWPAGRPIVDMPTLGRFVRGAMARAAELGLETATLRIHDHPQGETGVLEQVRLRGMRGLLFPPMGRLRRRIAGDFSRVAAVTIGYTLAEPALHRTCFDHFLGTWRLLEWLHARGYRRFGLALSEDIHERVGMRFRAALAAFADAVLHTTPLPPLALDAPSIDWPTRARHHPALYAWMRAHTPDAVLGMGAWVPEGLRAGGWRIPGDVAWLDLDLEPGDASAGLDQQHEVTGATAIDLLHGLLARGGYGPAADRQTVLLDGVIREGRTVAQR